MSFDTIQPPHEALYISSMLQHTKSARDSIEIVSKWLKLVSVEDKRALDLDRSELLRQLQSILHQAGCIARYFFPGGRKPDALHIGRAMQLRKAFDVDVGNPLSMKDLRNAIEHFDEHLDKYLTKHQSGEFVVQHVGYVPEEPGTYLHIFKGFYTKSMIFVLLGQSFEMAPIVNEVLRIHQALLVCESNGYRLPSLQRSSL